MMNALNTHRNRMNTHVISGTVVGLSPFSPLNTARTPGSRNTTMSAAHRAAYSAAFFAETFLSSSRTAHSASPTPASTYTAVRNGTCTSPSMAL